MGNHRGKRVEALLGAIRPLGGHELFQPLDDIVMRVESVSDNGTNVMAEFGGKVVAE